MLNFALLAVSSELWAFGFLAERRTVGEAFMARAIAAWRSEARPARLVLAVVAALVSLGCWAAQASAYIYWSSPDGGAIGRAKLAGTGIRGRFISALSHPVGVAVDGHYIYWTNDIAGTIERANLNGSGVDSTFITGANGPTAIALGRNGAYIYWTNSYPDEIGRANYNGTGAVQNFITGANQPSSVAVNLNYIYWTNPASGTIGRANLDGTGVDQSFITGANEPEGVVPGLNGAYIYWSNNQGGTIGRANYDGTGVDQSFITGAFNPSGLAVSDDYIYWTDGAHRRPHHRPGRLISPSIARADLDGADPVQRFIAIHSGAYTLALSTR